jgi:hypothetical protein
MAELKTKATQVSVDAFIEAVPDATRREDAKTLATMMERLTGDKPAMWGPSIIGFGSYRYKYDSGHEGEMCRIGFSPRKAELVLYVLNGNADQSAELTKLGKHRSGKGCLYVKTLADVDMAVLERLVQDKIDRMNAAYPA